MDSRRRSALVGALAALLVSVSLVGSLSAQKDKDKDKDKKRDEAQSKEVAALVKLVDDVSAGQPAPSAIGITLQNHFMKALDNKTYVPFTVTIDTAKMTSPGSAMYLRVVRKGGAPEPAAAPGAKKDDKKDPKKAKVEYPFEDIYFVDARPAVPGQPFKLSRAFAVEAGDYDVYFAVKERPAAGAKDDKNAPALATGLLKQTVSVPNYWNGELATSSVILAEKVEPLTAPLTKDTQAEHPYALGATQIIPAPDSKLPKKGELSLVFMIYNTGLDATTKKPDVSVEYNFHQKTTEGEKFFNKTTPQVFNATTLPPQFDLAQGHQLVAGQSIPLGTFPAGEYRLEIKIIDKVTSKNLTQNVAFSVVP